MIKSTGHADLPLHGGTVPKWLADRMMVMGTLIVESLVQNYGKQEVLTRLSDPLWFQSLGAVMGMDWHSSGITTSVMWALKRGLNPRAKELGIYICGGRGKYSRETPAELLSLSEASGLDGDSLVRSSKLCAKVDNTAVQDGFNLYQHNFILTDEGDWVVVQQGMNAQTKTARRYHWSSSELKSFVNEPHTAVIGENQGSILNLTSSKADKTRSGILEISGERPDKILKEISGILVPENTITYGYGGSSKANVVEQGLLFPDLESSKEEVVFEGRNIILPRHHEVQKEDVDLKRLGAVLVNAYERNSQTFDDLLLTPGLGPRTLQSLTLVSEVIHGTPSRFEDPARFSFAHGGKDGHPFPVPLKIYDESIRVLRDSIEKSKLGFNEKSEAIKRLHQTAVKIEEMCQPKADFEKTLEHERRNSDLWGGKTVYE